MGKIYEGVKVLDFSNNAAGPSAAAMFGDFGAEVIKIERPGAGDDSRSVLPRLEGQSLLYHWMNRSKKSITLALDDPRSKAVLERMIADADILIESFQPGVMAKFGLDYANVSKINPSIVYCSISICGQQGKYAKKPGFDLIAQAMSGFMDLTGDPDGPPVKCGAFIGDNIGTLNAFGAVSAAMYHRAKTGEGQHVDIALLDGLVAVNGQVEGAANAHTHPTRSGSHSISLFPYGIFSGKNGQSAIIAAYTPGTWSRLCKAMGRPELIDDPNFSTGVARGAHFKQLVELIEDWLCQFDKIDDAVSIMEEFNVPSCKTYTTDDALADEVFWERGIFVHQELPPSFTKHREMIGRGPWIHLSKTPATPTRSSDLGEYNYEILERYGMSKEEIDQCLADWQGKFKKG